MDDKRATEAESTKRGPSGDDAFAALQATVKGLLFPSESDKPIIAILFDAAQVGGAAGVEALRKMGAIDAGATVTSVTVADLLGPLGQEENWFGPEERSVADRFRKLLTLMGQLSAPTAYRVTPAAAVVDVYAIGSASDGTIVGFKTQVVET